MDGVVGDAREVVYVLSSFNVIHVCLSVSFVSLVTVF